MRHGWRLLCLLALGRCECPGKGEAGIDACQTDIFLGGEIRDETPKTVAPTQTPGRSPACADWPGCAPLGLFGSCCPSNGGAMLGCCSAPGRRLALLQMERKGVTIDDTTLQYCAGRLPATWPNAEAPLSSLRIFQTWNTQWPEEGRKASWEGLVDFVKSHGQKVLVGTPVTCVLSDDDRTWEWTKEFLSMVGPDHVMGLAIGNELELLASHADKTCIQELWEGGRLWNTFKERVREFDSMGFSQVPVTSVFTAAILSGNPFMDVPGKALVNTFLRQAMWQYGPRYAFTFNVYPYFDPNLRMNPGSRNDCSDALKRATCWQGASCLGPAIMIAARRKMQQLTGKPDDLFWIGEIGWSSPRAQALHTEMKRCQEFSSLATFQAFYSGFLQWDLTLPGVRPPDHIFYFTLRDALNFGVQEFFGLLLSCQSLGCKIATQDFEAEECELPLTAMPMSWRSWAFITLGILVACAAVSTCLYVRSPMVQRVVHWAEAKKPGRRVGMAEEVSSASSSSE